MGQSILYMTMKKRTYDLSHLSLKGELMEKIIPVSVAEIADMMGVTRQKVASLKHWGKLPDPDYVLKACPLWDKEKIENFLKEDIKDNRKKGGEVIWIEQSKRN